MFNSMYRGLLDGVDDSYTQYFDREAVDYALHIIVTVMLLPSQLHP
ncbi:MAG: hypothetical protein FWC73_05165 [Defluviitaleaceae bacterium]|nr:hypothetical protein [Defluviitaleaceae bacterium]